jgi:hypothetical protein
VTNVVLQDRCPEDITDHVGIIYDPIALQWTLNALGRAGPADPGLHPLCSDAVGGHPPVMFATPRPPRIAHRRAAVQLVCAGSVGRCVGRLVLRDRRGRLGSRAVSMHTQLKTFRVRLRRAPAHRIAVRVLTLQPGGWITATLRYTLRRKHGG